MLPTLRTERLVLRPWRPEDAATAFEIYSQWDVARFLGSTPRAMAEPSEAEAAVARWSAFEGPLHGVWAIVPDGADAPVGSALMKLLPASGTGLPTADTEVGWHLRREAWGRGYATEAGGRLLRNAREHGVPEVFAVTYPQNSASQRVCERLGMERLGLTERYYDMACELFHIVTPD